MSSLSASHGKDEECPMNVKIRHGYKGQHKLSQPSSSKPPSPPATPLTPSPIPNSEPKSNPKPPSKRKSSCVNGKSLRNSKKARILPGRVLGGLVALNVIDNPVFGLPFTHSSLPYKAHYVGATSPRCSPAHYLAAVQALLETYKIEVQTSMPDDESIDTRVTNVSPLVIGSEEKGWPIALPACDTLYKQSAPSKAFQYTLEAISLHLKNTHFNAVDQGNLNILSCFHAIFPSITNIISVCIRSIPPNNSNQVILIGAGYEDVIPSEISISSVLNRAIVGLVECEPATEDPMYPDSSSAWELPYTQARHPPVSSTSTCHGLALIRAISPSSSYMHILTPVPPAMLARCRVIVKGELELPIWGMLLWMQMKGLGRRA
ncbi:hypothetical protein BDR04DRAFT_1159807 [Suillus decipiens]|nr:hypothetical protein BDR04DRAFT_1159807 [Suillus decipiens]